MKLTEAGMEARILAGRMHLGRKRSDATRQRMRHNLTPVCNAPVPDDLKARAATLYAHGLSQRQAADAVGISLGALQRHLRAIEKSA